MAFTNFIPVRMSLTKRLNKLEESTKPCGTPVLFLIDLPLIYVNLLFSNVAIAYMR